MKPLSPRREREFKDRWSKNRAGFGDRKERAERWAYAVKYHPDAPEVVAARWARTLEKGASARSHRPEIADAGRAPATSKARRRYTYRAYRENSIRFPSAAQILKRERIALGLSRREYDRVRSAG